VPFRFAVHGFWSGVAELFSLAASHAMKKNKTCRNCEGSEFYSKDVTLSGFIRPLLPVGFFSEGAVHLRVCGSCGLLEWFVVPKTLDKVKQKFTKDA